MPPPPYKPHGKLTSAFPPCPKFTPSSLPSSLKGRVHIITGAASGIGYELAKILYRAGGTVYIAARSTARCEGAIAKIEAETETEMGKEKGKGERGEKGRLESLVVDLGDLRSVRRGVEGFLGREERLDVLVLNAGVMDPPVGSRDVLGHDLEFGTNCLGPHLMSVLLEPILIRTATLPDTPPFSVRMVFVVTMMQSWSPPQGLAMQFEKDGTPAVLKGMDNYLQSKTGCAWLSMDFARRLGKHGILSVWNLHPGLVKTELQRHWALPLRAFMATVTKPTVYAAYTELYAAYSPDVGPEQNGGHIMAWGRPAGTPPYIADGFKSVSEGGTGVAEKFFEYSNREIRQYM